MATLRHEKRVRTIEHTVTAAEDTANVVKILLNPNKKAVDKSKFIGQVQARSSAGVQTVTALTFNYNNTVGHADAGYLVISGAFAENDLITIQYNLYDFPIPVTNTYPL